MILPILLFGLLGVVFYWGLWNNDDRLPSTLIGRPIPEFALPPIEGRQDGLASANLLDQVSLVNVWASWCVPCRTENPLLVDLATRIGADRSGRVAIDWGVYGVPETYIIDAEGRIAYKHVGPFDQASLEEDILPVVRRLQAESDP